MKRFIEVPIQYGTAQINIDEISELRAIAFRDNGKMMRFTQIFLSTTYTMFYRDPFDPEGGGEYVTHQDMIIAYISHSQVLQLIEKAKIDPSTS